MSNQNGSIVAENDRQVLLRWAMRYTPNAKSYQRIVERTAMIIASDPDIQSQTTLGHAVKGLLHRVAQEELLRDE